MVLISDLLDMEELSTLMSEKRINKQVHPSLPISIYNYSNTAQFANIWSKAERVCRGLIVEDATGKVIARGPEKFFNFGQTGAPETDLNTMVRVTAKEDGSLGIGWTYSHEGVSHFGIATRGSFTSDQAIHATNNLDPIEIEAIEGGSPENWTYGGYTNIYEIVWKDNRIVLDYGDRDENIPLGMVNNVSGLVEFRPDAINKSEIITFRDALELDVPDDEEGYVVDILDPLGVTTGHVKLKGERYKQLHALLTNTTGRRIWIQLAARACFEYVKKEEDWASLLGNDPADFLRVNQNEDLLASLLTNVPDEFYDWVTKQIDSIEDSVSDLVAQARSLASQLKNDDLTPREQFQIVEHHPMRVSILRYARSGNIDGVILNAWKLSKPAGDETPFKSIED